MRVGYGTLRLFESESAVTWISNDNILGGKQSISKDLLLYNDEEKEEGNRNLNVTRTVMKTS